MRLLVPVCLIAVAALAGTPGLTAEFNPVRTPPRAAPRIPVESLIVKLRPGGAVAGAAALQSPRERIAALVRRNGLTLTARRPITALMHVVQVGTPAGEPAAGVLARLRADPEVEYAEPDLRRHVHALQPNDPLYLQQWYLQVAAATPSAIDAQDAWSTSTGSASVVIADIDTGVRPAHPDLASRLLPGYCFISESFVANGGACPGPGATDPGDWVTSADISSSPGGICKGATAEPSSWHGTRVAGILGAITDNGTGVAGVTWSTQILPVRALGKCGGLDSDIISGMLWAAGIPVAGVPGNPNPARIINMSIGGAGSCLLSYQDAISQVTAKGVLVVVSAGNVGGPVDVPANCPGVAGIAGLRQAGTKVGYSNLGPEIALAAPAGNCGNSFTGGQTACVYSLTTTTNLGAMGPDADDYTGLYYCDAASGSFPGCSINAGQYRSYNIGTSFSAPIVSGIAALMSAVNGKLNSCELIARLEEGAQPFPQTSLDATTTQPPMCHVPAGASDVQGSECICTRDDQTCGAGMANAPGALAAALRPIAAVALPASVSSGATVTLDGSASAAANGHVITSYQWSPVSGGLALALQGAGTSKASVTAPACGIGSVALTVTDDAGRTDTAQVVVGPTSATTTAPAVAGQGSCSVTPAAVEVAVCPGSDSVPAGGGSQSFTATLANTTNSAVTWQVNGVTGGNATVGTISTSGVYTPPAGVPSPATVTVSAVSVADAASSGSAQVTITAPPSSGGGGGGATDWLSLLAGAALAFAAARRRQRV